MHQRYIGFLFAAATLSGQETVIKVDVDLVNVFCSVRDKRGAYLKDLEKSHFTVLEDGKQQEIRYFTRETDLPLTIGLLVDVSKSQENLIEIEKRAAAQFFEKMLRPKDMAFLISFGAEAELLQDYTNSARLLRQGLDGLRLSVPTGGLHPGPVPTSRMRGTILYDAVYLAAHEKLKSEVGRKVVVVITDGVDTGSRVKVQEAIVAAHKSDVIIYSIYYADTRYYGAGNDSDLKKMADETGGRVFHVGRNNTLDDIFRQIQEEMRSQYLIGYSPVGGERSGAFRKLEIKTADKDQKVLARKGYYASR
ncbi:MAG: VWA domain-containing protein [Acidobacteriia bacterium]|nr:VWA domain-containing protein [Terriglobia bacterium]